MGMFSTKYENPSRTVTGTPQLYNNDVVLNCDTSLGAVTINLLEIATNFWNTQWRLYIVDSGNNSSVNNVTINAGVGQTINGASSVSISTNGAQVIIQISSNTNFIGLQSFCCLSGVSIISLTNAELLALITAGTIEVGANYLVTDANWTDGGIVLFGTSTTSVSLDGHSTHLNADYQLAGNYSGVVGYVAQLGLWDIFATPIVGNVVIWNNLHYVSLTGANPFAPSVDPINWAVLIKSVTNGYILEIDFSLYDKATNKITSRQDSRNNLVEFSFEGDIYSFDNFQWGNNVVTNNKIFGNYAVPINMMNCFWTLFDNNTLQGIVHCVDDLSTKRPKTFSRNRVGSGGAVYIWGNNTNFYFDSNEVLGIIDLKGISTQSLVSVYKNDISLGCQIQIANFIGGQLVNIYSNDFDNIAKLNIVTGDCTLGDLEIYKNTQVSTDITIGDFQGGNAVWRFNQIQSKSFSIVIPTLDSNITKGGEYTLLNTEYSNFPKYLDMSDPKIFNVGTSTLELGIENWVGLYYLTNTTGQTIQLIAGGGFENIEFISAGIVTDSFIINPVAINVSVSGEIIANNSLANVLTYTSFADYQDTLKLKAIGTGKYLISGINAAV